MVKATVAGIVAVLVAPAVLLLGLGVLLNPAAQGYCLPSATPPASTVASDGSVPRTSRVVFPIPAGTWVRTSGFGMREHPTTGGFKLHTGVDLAAPSGTHILAAADGRVVFAGRASGYGNLVLIEHIANGRRVASAYAHMSGDGIHVQVGDLVTAGQHVADVGMAGYVTGPHLHFEIRSGGKDGVAVDPERWLAANSATRIERTSANGTSGCTADAEAGPASSYAGSDPGNLVDDPTSEGRITERTAYALAQVRANFPSSAWSCWAPRPGTQSEHPKGRACDGTFGNAIGTAVTGDALNQGWRVTNWLKSNASTLGIEYLIWQGRIWSVARRSEGWRQYDGGGMHDATSVTGGHYDHLHFTVVN